MILSPKRFLMMSMAGIERMFAKGSTPCALGLGKAAPVLAADVEQQMLAAWV